ncbi:MAG: 2Fe-2S type ferredoxin [Psychromonas sp.]|uniref:YcbX family protein n=1 Tax=Psychromonas sp. TaxID=1884585 RepID=UPI0039E2BCB8
MQTLTDIYIYPIKSVKAISQPAAHVEEKGLHFDRRYMLIDEQGKFITGRTHPQLTQIEVQFSRKLLLVSGPNMPILTINPDNFTQEIQTSQVWEDNVNAIHCHHDYDLWFSDYLQQPCSLVFFGKETQRLIKNRDTQVSFADGYPLLLVNQTSVDFLNARLQSPVTALHFRPNIVVNGDFPFIEDSWARIKIGEVEFEVSKPCSRCLFINVDPQSGKADKEEPLNTLAKFRYHQGNIDFGQNLIPLNSGMIRAGDEIKILTTQAAPFYSAKQDQQSSNKKDIEIHYQGAAVTVTGDNQQLLLDQAEQAGIDIPYSCRGGQCGSCKVKLIEGEVMTLNNQGLSEAEIEQGYILACSCIPLSDITINY